MKYLKPINLYREILKSNNLNGGRLLGVEARRKYIYVAVSDADNKVALRLRNLAKTKTRVAEIQTLQSLISEYSVSGLVIGYPFERELGLPTAGVETKRFVDDLSKTGKFEDMNYTFWDETFKSLMKAAVEQKLKPYNIDPWPLTEILDGYAAWETLQGYLDFFSIRNQDQPTFVGEHGHLDYVNQNMKPSDVEI